MENRKVKLENGENGTVGGDFDWHFPTRSGPRVEAPVEVPFQAQGEQGKPWLASSRSSPTLVRSGHKWTSCSMASLSGAAPAFVGSDLRTCIRVSRASFSRCRY